MKEETELEELKVLILLFHPNSIKNKILTFCKETKKMSDIQNFLQISRGSVRHHLNFLEKYGLIEPMKRKLDEKGRPTYITSKLKKIEELKAKKNKIKEEMIKIKLQTPEVISFLKRLEINDIYKKDLKTEKEFIEFLSVIPFLELMNYVEKYYRLTNEGKEFLKENESREKPTLKS